MNTIYDNQANAYDFFPLNPKNKRKLSDLSVEELKEALFDKQVRAETFSQLDEASKEIMGAEIRQNIMTMVRIKKLLKQKALESGTEADTKTENLKRKIEELSDSLKAQKDRNSELCKQIEDKNQKHRDGIKGQQNRIDNLCKQIEIMNQKQHEKLERVRLANERNSLIHHRFKDVIKETYGMPTYLELISEANQRADKELNNG